MKKKVHRIRFSVVRAYNYVNGTFIEVINVVTVSFGNNFCFSFFLLFRIKFVFVSERQLIGLCSDLFAAGTETTSTTLAWAIIYMSLNPDIQERVHAEIDNVIGCDVKPTMHHRLQLPYTEAFILETQRLGDLVPLGVPHAVTEDVYFRGYFIPKRTMVMPNMYGVHMNPDVWPEPEKFKPERFLDSNGKIDKKELIPFSLGK